MFVALGKIHELSMAGRPAVAVLEEWMPGWALVCALGKKCRDIPGEIPLAYKVGPWAVLQVYNYRTAPVEFLGSTVIGELSAQEHADSLAVFGHLVWGGELAERLQRDPMPGWDPRRREQEAEYLRLEPLTASVYLWMEGTGNAEN